MKMDSPEFQEKAIGLMAELTDSYPGPNSAGDYVMIIRATKDPDGAILVSYDWFWRPS